MLNRVSHPYKTAGNVIVLYILIFTILDSRREDKKGSGLNGSKHYTNLISSLIKFLFDSWRKRTWTDNIKMDLKDTELERVD
jgi:hypothetical protein